MDLDRISNLCMSISTDWRDIQITYKNKKGREKHLILPLVITGSNGIYIFIDESAKEDCKEIYQQVEKLLNIRNEGLYIFVYDSNHDIDDETGCEAWAYDSIHHKFIDLKDIYEAFDVFYYNHYIPQSELHHYNFTSFADYFILQEFEVDLELKSEECCDRYVKPIISASKLEYVEKKLEELLSAGYKDGKYTYYDDGTMTVNKIIRSPDAWKKPWESYIETRTYDYPCSDEDGDKTLLVTALGGWFGLHKFRTGKFIQGLFYLLTCGCCCMFYFIDMVAVITGNYTTINNHYFRSQSGRVEKAQTVTYNRPVKHKKLFLLVPIMALLSVLLLNHLYIPVYEVGNNAIAGIIQGIYEEKFNNVPSSEDLENYTDILNSIEEVSDGEVNRNICIDDME